MNSNNFLWISPFLSFLFGYWIMHKIIYTPETITPYLVGRQLHSILPIMTQHNLNLRLIDEKEEIDLPEGIILSQTPAAGTAIRPNQSIFIVTSKKRCLLQTPQCVGLSINDIHPLLQSQDIQSRIYYVPHAYPAKYCFAQSPQHNELLETNKLILYVSSGNNKPIIWPNFIHLPLEDVIAFLDYYHIKPYIINDCISSSTAKCTVVEQRPLAGTLLTLDETKPLSVQLRIHIGDAHE